MASRRVEMLAQGNDLCTLVFCQLQGLQELVGDQFQRISRPRLCKENQQRWKTNRRFWWARQKKKVFLAAGKIGSGRCFGDDVIYCYHKAKILDRPNLRFLIDRKRSTVIQCFAAKWRKEDDTGRRFFQKFMSWNRQQDWVHRCFPAWKGVAIKSCDAPGTNRWCSSLWATETVSDDYGTRLRSERKRWWCAGSRDSGWRSRRTWPGGWSRRSGPKSGP